jgi:hypothetical protein
MNIAPLRNQSPRAALALGFILGSSLLVLQLAGQTATPSTTTGKPASDNKAAPANKPTRVRTSLEGFDTSQSGKSANQIGGASRDLGTPKLLAPNAGKSFTANPVFHWSMPEADAKITFKLSSGDGQTIYETSLQTDHLKYPADAPVLAPGSRYQWTILPENDILGGPPAPVSFVILSGAERDPMLDELKAANDASATAEIYVKHRVWYDAIQAYSDQLDRMPNDESARAARANLYDQLPVTKQLADADWKMVH